MYNDFFQWTPNGIFCPYGNFYLDAQHPVAHCVISHAHADHAVKNHQNIYCTAPTKAFMQMRYKAFAGDCFHVFEAYQTFQLGGVKITFFPAGHMLGSVQVLMEYNGVKYLYTGDFKTTKDHSCAAYECVETDVLLTESTFANPEFSHPNAALEIQKLNTISGNILLGAYALGKSQRITQLIHEFCPEKQILLHHSILPFHQIYASFGIHLGDFAPYSRKVIKSNSENQVYIVPPMTFGSYIRAHKIQRVFATGWHKHHQGNALALLISDHADWNEIIQMIENSKAKYVITTHGDGSHLANYFQGNKEVTALTNIHH